jgi:hypothetical protein
LSKSELELNSQYQEMLTGVQDLTVVESQHADAIALLRTEAERLGVTDTAYINRMEATYIAIRKVMKAEQDRARIQQLSTLSIQAGAITKYGTLERPETQRDLGVNAENNQYAEDARKLQEQKKQAYNQYLTFLEQEQEAHRMGLDNEAQDNLAYANKALIREYELQQGLENLEKTHKANLLQIEAAYWEAKWGFAQHYQAMMSEFNSTMLSMTQSTILKEIQPFKILARAVEDAFKSMLLSFFNMLAGQAAGNAAKSLVDAISYFQKQQQLPQLVTSLEQLY